MDNERPWGERLQQGPPLIIEPPPALRARGRGGPPPDIEPPPALRVGGRGPPPVIEPPPALRVRERGPPPVIEPPPALRAPGRGPPPPSIEPPPALRAAKAPAVSMRTRAAPALSLNVPKNPKGLPEYLTNSGTLVDGDISLNLKGLRVGTEEPSTPAGEGLVLEDLEIIKVIGKGASAFVQLVRHKWTNTIYALKVMELSVEESVRKNLMQELKINHQFKSANVVQCFHAFYHDGNIFIVLEYMDAGSLADVLKYQKTIREPHLAAISKRALLGLSALHQKHIIHRDIKPSNMLVNRRGEVKISDFGVSSELQHTMAQAATFVGTYTYMSPERINGGTYGLNCDIWALGLSILECAIGYFPYKPNRKAAGSWSIFEVLNTVVDKPAPVAPADQFSPEFCSFISDCLQKDPDQRASAAQLLKHPFLAKYEDSGASVADLCRESPMLPSPA